MWVRKEEDKDLWNLLEIWKLKMGGGVRQNSSHVIHISKTLDLAFS